MSKYQLKDTSIRVFEVIPPTVDTELGQCTADEGSGAYRGIPPSEVAKAVLKALAEDEYQIAIGQARSLMEGSRRDAEGTFQELNR